MIQIYDIGTGMLKKSSTLLVDKLPQKDVVEYNDDSFIFKSQLILNDNQEAVGWITGDQLFTPFKSLEGMSTTAGIHYIQTDSKALALAKIATILPKVATEKDILDSKLKKLSVFVNDADKMKSLDIESQQLLVEQHSIMEKYSSILLKRIIHMQEIY